MFKKLLSLTLIVCFFLTTVVLPQAHANTVLDLPQPGSIINLSSAYEPVMIKGLTVHKDNPFLFNFIVDVGQDKMAGEALKKEGEKLIKYFLASLAIPDKDLWVNLSPYEKDKTVPEVLGQTDMGRDLLAQDYVLKQLTASLIYPEKELGKKFWDKVYAKAREKYGATEIPVNTFNKVWIMADKAEVFEHNQTVFVVGSYLKVMLEEDYLAVDKNQRQPGDMALAVSSSTLPSESALNVKATQRQSPNAMASQIIREIILPEIEHEVNQGQNFANLRQIFNSIILSSWYKRNLKEALLNQVYADKAKVKGIDLNDPTIKQQIYDQYLKAYKKGVFNYIKEDNVQGQKTPRKYFSGGMRITPAHIDSLTPVQATSRLVQSSFNGAVNMEVGIRTSFDTAMNAIQSVTADNPVVTTALNGERIRVEILKDRQGTYISMGGRPKIKILNTHFKVHLFKGIILLEDGVWFYKYAVRSSGEIFDIHWGNSPTAIQLLEGALGSKEAITRYNASIDGSTFILTPQKGNKALRVQIYPMAQMDAYFRKNITTYKLKAILSRNQTFVGLFNYGEIIKIEVPISGKERLRKFFLQKAGSQDTIRIDLFVHNGVLRVGSGGEYNDLGRDVQALKMESAGITVGFDGKFAVVEKTLYASEYNKIQVNDVAMATTTSVSELEASIRKSLMIVGSKIFFNEVPVSKAKMSKVIENGREAILQEGRKNWRISVDHQFSTVFTEALVTWGVVKNDDIISGLGETKIQRMSRTVAVTKDNSVGIEIFLKALERVVNHGVMKGRNANNQEVEMSFLENTIDQFAQKIDSLQGVPLVTPSEFGQATEDFVRSLQGKPLSQTPELNRNVMVGESRLYREIGDTDLILSVSSQRVTQFTASIDSKELDKELTIKLHEAIGAPIPEVLEIDQGSYYQGMILKDRDGKSYTFLSQREREYHPVKLEGFHILASGVYEQIMFTVITDKFYQYLKTSRFNNFAGVTADGIGWAVLSESQARQRYEWLKPYIAWKDADLSVTVDQERLANDGADKMMGAETWKQGGIDLNTSSSMQWKMAKDGKGVEMNVDAAMIARIRREGIDWAVPVIFRVTPITNIWPLIGLQPPLN